MNRKCLQPGVSTFAQNNTHNLQSGSIWKQNPEAAYENAQAEWNEPMAQFFEHTHTQVGKVNEREKKTERMA